MEFVRAVRKLASAMSGNREKIQQADLERWGIQNVTLRPYQLEGISWLAERFERGHGCILGDEMGLGKTLQVLPCLAAISRPTTDCIVWLDMRWASSNKASILQIKLMGYEPLPFLLILSN